MKNIPVFDTENGVASLVLKEIPYYQAAYIHVLDTLSPAALLEECVAFCRMLGAENIYASGHEYLQRYPLHAEILHMQVQRSDLPDTDASVIPLTEDKINSWQEIYNQKMSGVANASYMTQAETHKLCQAGGAYFIHRNGKLLGIGIASGDRIDAVASVEKGRGKDCILALNHALSCDMVHLEVASTNLPALKLYESLGFVKTSVVSQWFKIM